MYGGQCTQAYFQSALNLKEELTKQGIAHDWLTGRNESLITRARNSLAATFLEETDYEKLLFIDADIEFSPQDVAALWNMNEDVVAGVYAMKNPDACQYAAWVDGKLVSDLDQFGSEPLPVDYAGTGFMMISRNALTLLAPYVDSYEAAGLAPGETRVESAFFDTSIEDGIYLSEDYYFCKRWREQDGRIVMLPNVRLKHWGSYAYGSP